MHIFDSGKSSPYTDLEVRFGMIIVAERKRSPMNFYYQRIWHDFSSISFMQLDIVVVLSSSLQDSHTENTVGEIHVMWALCATYLNPDFYRSYVCMYSCF